MTDTTLIVASLLVLLTSGSLLRVVIGPTGTDRMLGVQLLGTASAALSLVLSVALSMPRLIDLALVFGMLAGVTTAVFVTARPSRAKDPNRESGP